MHLGGIDTVKKGCCSAMNCIIKPKVSVFKYKSDALFKKHLRVAQLGVEQTSSSKALPTITESKLPKPMSLHDKPRGFPQKGIATNTCASTLTSGDAPWWKVKPLPYEHIFISLFNTLGVGNPKVSLKLSVLGFCDKQKLNSLDLVHKSKQLLNAHALKPACWVKPKPLLEPKASRSHALHKPQAHMYCYKLLSLVGGHNLGLLTITAKPKVSGALNKI